ncbi:MAG TPA: D-alanyl-D-alanine carboxypeptidase/D-alanyl-D-alanine-endopeptidase [Candidatus Obscuribacterales bacterium]
MLHIFKSRIAGGFNSRQRGPWSRQRGFGVLLLLLCSLPAQAAMPAAGLRQVLQQPGLAPAYTGVRIISADSGEPILEQNAETPLMPASNMKVITSSAALSLLKPEFRFKTQLLTDGRINGETLQGNLYLKGYGDPVLSDERLQKLVEELRFLGIRKVSGNLVADDSFFDQERTGRGWKSSYGAAAYSAQISALALNLNTVEVRVRPTQVGQAASISLKPENTFFEIINKTGTSGGRTRLSISRQLVNGHNQIIVSGNLYVRGATEIEKLNLDNPTLYVGNVAQNLMRKEGIGLTGKIVKGTTPAGAAILASSESPPLREVVSELNKNSVNLIAENLLKFLGATFAGAPGTAAKGAKVVMDRFLVGQVGLPHNSGLVIADGSGLSPLNRMTAETLTRVLQHMFQQYDVSVDFIASLPIAGVDGTLKKRMIGPEIKRRVRAKTGFINGASSLSGYLYTKHNKVLIFSFLMNHYSNFYAAVSTQDRICRELVNWEGR